MKKHLLAGIALGVSVSAQAATPVFDANVYNATIEVGIETINYINKGNAYLNAIYQSGYTTAQYATLLDPIRDSTATTADRLTSVKVSVDEMNASVKEMNASVKAMQEDVEKTRENTGTIVDYNGARGTIATAADDYVRHLAVNNDASEDYSQSMCATGNEAACGNRVYTRLSVAEKARQIAGVTANEKDNVVYAEGALNSDFPDLLKLRDAHLESDDVADNFQKSAETLKSIRDKRLSAMQAGLAATAWSGWLNKTTAANVSRALLLSSKDSNGDFQQTQADRQRATNILLGTLHVDLNNMRSLMELSLENQVKQDAYTIAQNDAAALSDADMVVALRKAVDAIKPDKYLSADAKSK